MYLFHRRVVSRTSQPTSTGGWATLNAQQRRIGTAHMLSSLISTLTSSHLHMLSLSHILSELVYTLNHNIPFLLHHVQKHTLIHVQHNASSCTWAHILLLILLMHWFPVTTVTLTCTWAPETHATVLVHTQWGVFQQPCTVGCWPARIASTPAVEQYGGQRATAIRASVVGGVGCDRVGVWEGDTEYLGECLGEIVG